MNFRSMEEFWVFYISQHSKPGTRRWHFAGTLCSIICLVYSLLFNWWVVISVPLIGYGMAWYSHFFIEGNVPATFGHPFWSLLCDYKMFGLMLTGEMDREIKRLGEGPNSNTLLPASASTSVPFLFAHASILVLLKGVVKC